MKDILSFREMEQHWDALSASHGLDVVLVLDYVAPPSTSLHSQQPTRSPAGRGEDGMLNNREGPSQPVYLLSSLQLPLAS